MTTSCCPSLTDKARPPSLEVGKEREGTVAGELCLWGLWGVGAPGRAPQQLGSGL